MEPVSSKSSPIPLLCSAVCTSTDSRVSASAEKAIDQSLFIPIIAEEQPKSPADDFGPTEDCMTLKGPLVTPDACPLLSFEDDRRVRFRDFDEEWLLTEEMSVTSASVRCSEEASTAEASAAKSEVPSPSGEVSCGLVSVKGQRCMACKGSGSRRPSQEQISHPETKCSLLRNDTLDDCSFDSTLAAVSPGGALVGSTMPHHLWWPARGNGSGVDAEQHCSPKAPTPGSRTGTRRGRRHTAPGGFKTALIRSADGSLRRRPLHSPPCLTTIHPPKSCVRLQSENSVGVFPTYWSRTSIGSMFPSSRTTANSVGLPTYMPQGSQAHVMVHRRLRAVSGPCFSAVLDSSPFSQKSRPYQPHISQPGALVDIASWEID